MSTPLQNTTIEATEYATMREAVDASGIDLSYNPALADRDIARDDKDENHKRFFATEDGRVFYTYQADILIFHKYDPFSTCLDDSPFVSVSIVTRMEKGRVSIRCHYEGTRFPNNARTRKFLANSNAMVTGDYHEGTK